MKCAAFLVRVGRVGVVLVDDDVVAVASVALSVEPAAARKTPTRSVASLSDDIVMLEGKTG